MSIDTTKTITSVTYNGVSIPLAGGGGGSYTGKKVTFMDYDGTILKQEYAAPGATVSTPSAPSHTGLTFSGWASPLQAKSEIATAGSVTVGNTDLVVGALYNTSATQLTYKFPTTGTTTYSIEIAFDSSPNYSLPATVDWGDGTAPGSVGTSSLTHDYNIGTLSSDTVTITLTDGTYESGHGYAITAVSPSGLCTGAIISDGCIALPGTYGASTTGTFQNAYNMKYCLLSDVVRSSVYSSSQKTTIPAINQYSFQGSGLKFLTIPDNNSVGNDILNGIPSLTITYGPYLNTDVMGSRRMPALASEARIFENSYPNAITGFETSGYGNRFMMIGNDTFDLSNTAITSLYDGQLYYSEGYQPSTIIMPNLTSVGSRLNYNMSYASAGYLTSVTLIDFRALTSMPSYSGASDYQVFYIDSMGMRPVFNPLVKIVVPDSLYSQFTDTASHPEWSNVAQYIVRASDYTD